MMIPSRLRSSLLIALLVAATGYAPAQHGTNRPEGIFQGSSDIGTAQPGSSIFDPGTSSYRVSGGGEDVWGTSDDFRLTWAAVAGDTTLSADVQVSQPSTYPKAKGMLMFRQSLDPGSPYAAISIHADGHITLQGRLAEGGQTRDTDLPEHGAVRLRIERKGDRFTAYALTGTMQTPNAPSITIPMHNPVYVGIGVCSHDPHALQTVLFSKVKIDHGDHTVRAAQVSDR